MKCVFWASVVNFFTVTVIKYVCKLLSVTFAIG
jgi:hypothetical protein